VPELLPRPGIIGFAAGRANACRRPDKLADQRCADGIVRDGLGKPDDRLAELCRAFFQVNGMRFLVWLLLVLLSAFVIPPSRSLDSRTAPLPLLRV
jgi:hypothetical protein